MQATCFALALCLTVCCHAQQNGKQKIDSLQRQLATAKGKHQLPVLTALFDSYKDSAYATALAYANQYYHIARAAGDSAGMVEGGRKQAYALMDLGKNEEAVKVLGSILDIAERNQWRDPKIKTHIKFILNNAGLAHNHLGNYDKA
ncbi:MAG: hypothetical protein ACKO96_04305, partial [Flammeovirgaceae bacterium]